MITESKSELNFKYIGDGVDQVCEDLVGHTNWAWGDTLYPDLSRMTDDIDSIIIIYKEPGDDDE